MRVFEDVKLKIGLGASWDGSYRRAGRVQENGKTIRPYTDASYDSSMGRLRFYPNGDYELNSQDGSVKGRYAFFRINDKELLELRPDRNGIPRSTQNNEDRMIFRIAHIDENLSLFRVRLGSGGSGGAGGIQELQEGRVLLTRIR
jgi:hypothetical protein